MGREFVAGYVSLAEGEKDPRNLLVAFAIARVILIEFDISDRTEVCVFIFFGNHFDSILSSTVAVQYHILLFSDHFPTSTK